MRIDYLDIAKGLGLLLVIAGHALELYTPINGDAFTAWKFIYAFHMPLFFLLSGMAAPALAAARPPKIIAGALFLILAAALLQFLVAPLRLALPLPADPPITSALGALRAIIWPALKFEAYALVVIWFLPCLALVRLAAWLIATAGPARAAAVIVALVALCVAEQTARIGYWQFRSVIVGLAFFAQGQQLVRLPLSRVPRPAMAAALVATLLLTALTFDLNQGCTFTPMHACPGPNGAPFAVLMASGAFGFPPLFALTAIAGSLATLAAALLLAASPLRRLLLRIGRRTLDLLVVNGLVLVFLQPALAPHIVQLPPPLVIALLLVVQLALAYAVHPVLDRFFALTQSAATWLASARLLPHPSPWTASSEEPR